MTITIGQSIPTIPVPNQELMDGLQEGYNQSGPWAVKKYIVYWNDRFTFAQAMAGSSKNSGGKGGATLRAKPYPYPANPIMYAKELTIEPDGEYVTPNTPAAFEYAIITVVFGALSWDAVASDDPFGLNSIGNEVIPYCQEEVTYGYDTVEMPPKDLTYDMVGGTKLNYSVQIRVPVLTLNLTFEKFPIMPTGLIESYLGTLNETEFLGFAARTVFFDGCETAREMSFSETTSDTGYFNSNATQRVRLVFRWRAIPWTQVINPDDAAWHDVFKQSGDYIYDVTELNDMIDLFIGSEE